MNKKDVFHTPPAGGYCQCAFCRGDRKNLKNYYSKWTRRESKFIINCELENLDEKLPVWVYITDDEDLINLED